MIIYEDTKGDHVILAEEFTTPEVEKVILANAAPRAREGLMADFREAHELEDRLLSRATPAQQAIGQGDHVWCELDAGSGVLGGARRIQVYGRLLTQEEVFSEDASTTSVIRDGRARGWLYGWYYSELCPEGELGARHLATVEPITVRQFKAAQAAQWAIRPPAER